MSVDVGEDEARIESGRSKFALRVLAADDFPRLPEVAGSGVRMDATALAEALRQVIPAASRDDARPILTGVLLVAEGSGLRLVATDSYRLGVRDLPGESVLAAHLSGAAAEGKHVLVPAKALGELQRLLGSGGGPRARRRRVPRTPWSCPSRTATPVSTPAGPGSAPDSSKASSRTTSSSSRTGIPTGWWCPGRR